MMKKKKQLLEAGIITTTHGVKGAVRIQPWTDTPEFLCGFERFFIDGEQVRVLSASVHKSVVLCYLEGVEDLDAAIAMRGKKVYINRDDFDIEEGRYLIQDLIGIRVVDLNIGDIGIIADVLTLPANDVYVVQGEKRYMIPAVAEFVKKVDLEGDRIEVEIIEGMES